MIYLMRFSNKEEVFYKVGVSKCPERRLLELSKGDYKGELVYTSPIGCISWFKVEKAFHNDNPHRKIIPKHSFSVNSECYQLVTPHYLRKHIRNNLHLTKWYDREWIDPLTI